VKSGARQLHSVSRDFVSHHPLHRNAPALKAGRMTCRNARSGRPSAAAFDETTNTAIFFATFHARHTGEGGPAAPTNKETHTDDVLQMNDEHKVASMVKVWNAPWAL
jgi:hypothetical protein